MKKSNGFTLIELMIVVAILGILTTIAYPSYRDYILKSERAVAQVSLVSLSHSMERFYSENNTYTGALIPSIHPDVAPSNGSRVTHNLAIDSIATNGASYSLSATSVTDTTDILTLTSTGIRSW
ncbi:MAG: type IV pilin protein [Gammaproteobacteria bacterium]|nr:type IV pilin protein [Gammaproteobacteria bacterium]